MLEHQNIKDHQAYLYAKNVVDGEIIANEQITTVCQRFIDEINQGEDCDYYFDYNALDKVSALLKLINMAEGTLQGKPVFDSLVGFQWFFIVNIFCWRQKDNHNLRRYKTATLLIGRKNSKVSLF